MENHNVAYTQSDQTMEIIQVTNHKKCIDCLIN